MVWMEADEFEELVARAVEEVPEELFALVDNCLLIVEDRNEDEPDILGLYEGVALTERTSEYTSALPDKITIYRLALQGVVDTREELVEQVAITVIHELGHHFGIDDARLHELGWG